MIDFLNISVPREAEMNALQKTTTNVQLHLNYVSMLAGNTKTTQKHPTVVCSALY